MLKSCQESAMSSLSCRSFPTSISSSNLVTTCSCQFFPKLQAIPESIIHKIHPFRFNKSTPLPPMDPTMMAPSPLALAWPPSSVYSTSHLGPGNDPSWTDDQWLLSYNFSHFFTLFVGVQWKKISPPKKYLAVNLVRGDVLTSKKNVGIQNELMAPQLVHNSQLHTVPMTTALGFSVSKSWNSCDQNGIRMWNNSWSSLQILGRIHFWDTCVIKGVYQIVSQMYLVPKDANIHMNILDLLFLS